MSSTIRVIVVDDEPPARALVREYLSGDERFELVAECANGLEAVRSVARFQPDLVLLDVQMPKLDGFEVLELLDPRPRVVFVTAYDEYAVRAFEVHAVDYLLKPFSRERFDGVLERVAALIGRGDEQPLSGVVRAARGALPLQRILVRRESDIEVIAVQKVDYIEAQDDAVCIVSGGTRHLKQQTLGELEEQLDPRRFIRVHRSYILNIDRLSKVELYAKDSRVAILSDGTRIPVSRAGYARLRELL